MPKFSEYAAATALTDDDLFLVTDSPGAGPSSKKATALVLKSYATSEAMVVVTHGSTAGTARPSGAAAVYWIGSVEPTNAVDHDLWYDTDA